MDGSTTTSLFLVEIKPGELIHIQHPDTGERRAVRSDTVLLGTRSVLRKESWFVFEDGFGIRESQLKAYWDDLKVEVKGEDGQDVFDD